MARNPFRIHGDEDEFFQRTKFWTTRGPVRRIHRTATQDQLGRHIAAGERRAHTRAVVRRVHLATVYKPSWIVLAASIGFGLVEAFIRVPRSAEVPRTRLIVGGTTTGGFATRPARNRARPSTSPPSNRSPTITSPVSSTPSLDWAEYCLTLAAMLTRCRHAAHG